MPSDFSAADYYHYDPTSSNCYLHTGSRPRWGAFVPCLMILYILCACFLDGCRLVAWLFGRDAK
jgi:hypothetical protein